MCKKFKTCTKGQVQYVCEFNISFELVNYNLCVQDLVNLLKPITFLVQYNATELIVFQRRLCAIGFHQ